MPPRKRTDEKASRKRQLPASTEELSYDEVANLGAASPKPTRGKMAKKSGKAAAAVAAAVADGGERRSPPRKQRLQDSTQDEDSGQTAVAVNPTPTPAERGVVSGSKKPRSGDAAPADSPQSFPKGSQVRIRDDTQNHAECIGKEGEVLKPGANWTKVAVRGGADDGVSEKIFSFRTSDLDAPGGRSERNGKVKSKSNSSSKAASKEKSSSGTKSAEGAGKPPTSSSSSSSSSSASSSSSSSSSSLSSSARTDGDGSGGSKSGGGSCRGSSSGSSSSSSGGSVCAYPEPSTSGLSTSQAARALGRGEGAASGKAAAELVVAAAAHEVDHVTSHLKSLEATAAAAAAGGGGGGGAGATAVQDAAPLVGLLEACASSVSKAVPVAVAEARSRRVLSGSAQREAKLKQTLTSLAAELASWEAAEAKQAAHKGAAKKNSSSAVSAAAEGASGETNDGGDDDDTDEAVSADDDDDDADDAEEEEEVDEGQGFELELGKALGAMPKRHAEAAALALDTLCAQTRAQAKLSIEQCSSAGASLAKANQQGHFANYIPGDPSGESVVEAATDPKSLLRKMIGGGSSSSSSSSSSSFSSFSSSSSSAPSLKAKAPRSAGKK